MRELIKKILKEEQDNYNTLEMIKNYFGDNVFLNDLKEKLHNKGRLTDKQLESAVKVFKREHWSETLVPKINEPNSNLRSLIMNLGVQTYNRMVRTDKKFFLTQSFDGDDKIIVGKPSPQWIKRNEDDLKFFKHHIVDSGKEFLFPDRDKKTTVTDETDELFNLLQINDFHGFIENGEWSILNRLGTNWSNWGKMIGHKEKEGLLGDGSDKSKIENYFKQQPITDIIDGKINSFLLKMFPTMSLAEFDLAEAFQEVDAKLKSSQLERIKSRIMTTTESGESVEREFISWLQQNGVSEIRNFSSFGNVVDITFSVDLMAKLKGVWVPIQVKSGEKSASGSQIHKFDIGGIAVYPAPKKLLCGNWVYVKSNKGLKSQSSFDEDYLNLRCERDEDFLD